MLVHLVGDIWFERIITEEEDKKRERIYEASKHRNLTSKEKKFLLEYGRKLLVDSKALNDAVERSLDEIPK